MNSPIVLPRAADAGDEETLEADGLSQISQVQQKFRAGAEVVAFPEATVRGGTWTTVVDDHLRGVEVDQRELPHYRSYCVSHISPQNVFADCVYGTGDILSGSVLLSGLLLAAVLRERPSHVHEVSPDRVNRPEGFRELLDRLFTEEPALFRARLRRLRGLFFFPHGHQLRFPRSDLQRPPLNGIVNKPCLFRVLTRTLVAPRTAIPSRLVVWLRWRPRMPVRLN